MGVGGAQRARCALRPALAAHVVEAPPPFDYGDICSNREHSLDLMRFAIRLISAAIPAALTRRFVGPALEEPCWLSVPVARRRPCPLTRPALPRAQKLVNLLVCRATAKPADSLLRAHCCRTEANRDRQQSLLSSRSSGDATPRLVAGAPIAHRNDRYSPQHRQQYRCLAWNLRTVGCHEDPYGLAQKSPVFLGIRHLELQQSADVPGAQEH